MRSALKVLSLLLPVGVAAVSPAACQAGTFWSWGHPGYATSYYAPYSSYSAYGYGASYAPSYYGPSAGCCGSTCNSCQANYGGCDSCGMGACGCNSCGYGACGCGDGCNGGCANGNCSGGNCGMNAAPAGSGPIPDPNTNAPTPRTPESRPITPRTYENSDAPTFTAPRRTTPMNDPMDEPLGGGLPSESSGRTAPPPSRTPLPTDDNFRSRTPPSRSPAPTDPLDNTIDPANAPAGFGAGKLEIPATPTVIPQRSPAHEIPVNDGDVANEPPLAPETQPQDGPLLDLKTTTAPVVSKSRVASSSRLTASRMARQPRPDSREWSVAPAPAHLARQ